MAQETQVTLLLRLKDLASRGLGAFGDKLDGIDKKIRTKLVASMALLAGAVATGVAGAFTLAVRSAVEFQTKMAYVQTVMIDQSKKALTSVSRSLLEMSLRVPKSAAELSEGLYQIMSSGFAKTEDGLLILETAAKAGVAGLADVKDAAYALTGVLNAFQLPASRVGQVADVLFKTVAEGVVEFGELSREIGDVAPTAALAGVSLEEIGAAIATFTKSNVSARVGITSLNMLLLRIINPQEQAAKAAERLGLQWNLAALRTKGLAGMMRDLNTASHGNVEVMNQVIPEIEAFKVGAILAGTGIGEFEAQLKKMTNAQGAADVAFKIMNGTIANQFQLLKNKFNVVMIEAGTVALPALTESLSGPLGPLDTLRKYVNENKEGIEDLAKAIGNIGGFVANALIWIGRLTVKLGGLLTLLSQIHDPTSITSRPEIARLGAITDPVVLAREAERLRREIATKEGQLPGLQSAADAMRSPNGLKRAGYDQAQERADDLGYEIGGLANALKYAEARIRELATGTALSSDLGNPLDPLKAPGSGGGGGGTSSVDRAKMIAEALSMKGQAGLSEMGSAEQRAFAARAREERENARVTAAYEHYKMDPSGQLRLASLDESSSSTKPGRQSFEETAFSTIENMIGPIDAAEESLLGLKNTLGEIAGGLLVHFSESWTDAFEALGEGAGNLGQAMMKAVRGALAGEARDKARLTAIDALKAAAQGLTNPAKFAEAAKLFAVSAAYGAAAGFLGGGGGGSGSRGGNLSAGNYDRQTQAARDSRGDAELIIVGDPYLDTTNPDKMERLAKAIKNLGERRKITIRHRT